MKWLGLILYPVVGGLLGSCDVGVKQWQYWAILFVVAAIDVNSFISALK